jgi:hypothetical protein
VTRYASRVTRHEKNKYQNKKPMSEIARKIKSVNWQRFVFVLLMALLVAGADSCKSSGKMSKKERKAQIEQAKQQLKPIISGTSTLSYDEQKRIVGEIMDKNLNDPVLNEMIIQAQQKLKTLLAEETKTKAQKVDLARATLYDLLLNKDNKSADELETAVNSIKRQNLGDTEIDELISRVETKIKDMRSGGGNLPMKTQLENAFTTIANASKTGNLSQADNTIQKTLQYFSSDDAPVLIIISREGSTVDYDKPTTIKRYLQFLKDTKASKNDVDAIMTDTSGKIKGLDLIKKY